MRLLSRRVRDRVVAEIFEVEGIGGEVCLSYEFYPSCVPSSLPQRDGDPGGD